ncbi:hypothetical protein LJR220_006208 [Bradyrhizobium sp. LjRoot220]|uniref:hypothetical protein n=1 Tax=Bradyrhizobium sp. LjRoot220 TaxID=3342284 RepID=UPI003ECD612A
MKKTRQKQEAGAGSDSVRTGSGLNHPGGRATIAGFQSRMSISSRSALKIRSCLCHEAVKDHLEDVLRGSIPTRNKAISPKNG